MLVPAPGRFSTTTGLPRRSSSFAPRSRARTSVAPPGVKGTTIVIGRFGKSCACPCACAPRTNISGANISSVSANRALHFNDGMVPPRRSLRRALPDDLGHAAARRGRRIAERELAIRERERPLLRCAVPVRERRALDIDRDGLVGVVRGVGAEIGDAAVSQLGGLLR